MTQPTELEPEVNKLPRWPLLASALLLLLALGLCFGGILAVVIRGEVTNSTIGATYLLCIMPALLMVGAAAGLWWVWIRPGAQARFQTRWEKIGQFLALVGAVTGIALWLGGAAILLGGAEVTQGALIGGSITCFIPGLLLLVGATVAYFFSRGITAS